MKFKGCFVIEVIFFELYVGGKFGQGVYKVLGGLYGVGFMVVNVFLIYFDVIVNKYKQLYYICFEWGVFVQLFEVFGVILKDVKWFIKVSFYFDFIIFKEFDNQFDYLCICNCLCEFVYLMGLKIVICDECIELYGGEIKEEVFYEKGGIVNFVCVLVIDDIKLFYDQLVVMCGIYVEVEVEVVFIYVNIYVSDNILIYVNMICICDGGILLIGFKMVYICVFNKYVKDKNFIKVGNLVLSGDDLFEGIYCVVSVKVGDLQFELQVKVKLFNSEVQMVVNVIVGEKFVQFFEENFKIGKIIVEKVVEVVCVCDVVCKVCDIVWCFNLFENDDLFGKFVDCFL